MKNLSAETTAYMMDAMSYLFNVMTIVATGEVPTAHETFVHVRSLLDSYCRLNHMAPNYYLTYREYDESVYYDEDEDEEYEEDEEYDEEDYEEDEDEEDTDVEMIHLTREDICNLITKLVELL